MSDRSGTSALTPMTLEEPGAEQASPRAPGPLRCGPCAVWPRQQTWLCAVPLVMGFVGLGLSLMLLKWIVVGSVQDYVPTDLVDPKGSIGQDPIFLSKPSAMPKGPDTATATSTLAASTAASVSTTTPLAADGTAPVPRTRTGPPANHSANGSAANGDTNRAPHLHNRVGSRTGGGGNAVTISTTRASRLTPPPGAKEGTPRSTVRKGTSGSNGRNGVGNSKPGQTSASFTTTTPTTSTAIVKTVGKAHPTTSQPVAPVKPTSRWNHGRPGKGPATRPHHRFRTPVAPTQPSLRSEVFKPCVEDKDLAFCLNEGECSIIETVAGVHRHCRCKEGYHGLRCDQFVPKTDAILSDPMDELGIEFMESGDTYQRQVLSIFSIASGICLLGVACMALYRRNKRHREKLQAHFSNGRSLRDCSINAPGPPSKPSSRLQYSLHFPKSCTPHGLAVKNGVAALGASTANSPILCRALSKGKRFRSSSLSLSPGQRRRENPDFRTPPAPREKHKIATNLIDGSKVSGHVYRHLEEDDSPDTSMRRYDSAGERVGSLLARTSLCHLAARRGWTEVPCTRLDGDNASLPATLRTRSVPIIPSLQACDVKGADTDAPSQARGGLLRWHPLLVAGKPATTMSHSPCAPIKSVPLLSERSLGSARGARSVEITAELAQELKKRHLRSSQEMSCSHSESRGVGGTNAQDSLAGSTAGGLAPEAGQREAQGLSQGQPSPASEAATCTSATGGAVCRASGGDGAKPSAS